MWQQLIRSFIVSSAVALPFWVLGRIAYRRVGRVPKGSTSVAREILLAAFVLYIIGVAAITIVPLHMAGLGSRSGINLIPLLWNLKCLIRTSDDPPEMMKFCLENIAGNIVLFMPLGWFLPLLYNRFSSLAFVLLAAMLASVGIESIQFAARMFGSFRSVDIDDCILNVLGACAGFMLWRHVCRWRQRAESATQPGA